MKLIPYKGGDYTVPSIFAIDDKGNELIGHEAKRQWQLNPQQHRLRQPSGSSGRSFQQRRRRDDAEVVGYEVRPGDRNDVVIDVATARVPRSRRSPPGS